MKIGRIGSFFLLHYLYYVTCHPTNDKKVLLILIDGFRWDYLNLSDLSGFTRIANEGVKAEYMEALYPSESYPGYYSVATGLFAESHGMVLNHMYDAEHDKISQMTPNNIVKESFWWEDAEPIWITASKNNIPTAMLMWPGSSTFIKGQRAAIFEPYSSQDGVDFFRFNLNRVLELFKNNQIKYAQVYCEYTDKTGHAFGPDSSNTQIAIRELDRVMNELLNNITTMGLNDSVHLVIVSDHGMAATDSNSVVGISIDDILTEDTVVRVLDRGSHMGIYPAPGINVDQMIDKLKMKEGLNVYKKQDIPLKYHFKNHRRVPPVYIVVKKGYFLKGLSNIKQYPNDLNKEWNGFHGYDPAEPDMRAIFLAWGKSFKKGFKSPPIHITDPYNLLTHLIGMEGLPNNGSWSKMEILLENNAKIISSSILITFISFIVIFI